MRNKKIVILAVLTCLIWPISHNAQYSDVFNPIQMRLERLIWSDSLSEEERIWMQSVLDTLSFSELETAVIAQGVFLERLELNFKSTFSEFEDLMNNKLQLAKMSPDPTLYLLSFLPYVEMANRPESAHRYSSANDYVLKFLLIRMVKQIRSGNSIASPYLDDFICSQDEYEKLLFHFAEKSFSELINDFEIIAVNPDSFATSTYYFGWLLTTYRKDFPDYFKKYYSPELYNALSDDAQDIVLNYWVRNHDLIERGDLTNLMHLIESELAKNYHKRSIQFTLLKCLIENCTREDYLKRIDKYFDKDLQRRYDDITRMRLAIENRSRVNPLTYEWTSFPETLMPFTFRPELTITWFMTSSPLDIVKYLEENLNPEFYRNPGFLSHPKTLDFRASTQRLGSFEGKMGNQLQNKIDMITSRILDLCILDCHYCYEEGGWLILGMGKSALHGLKQEFLSPDKKRVEMASQLLLLMKDEEVVRWLMEIITTSEDKDVLIWSPAYLYMMEKFTPNPMPNRGITMEESDRITKEIIEPFFKTLYPQGQE